MKVPSRKDLQTRMYANGKVIVIEHHTVFGWKVYRHLMPAGAQMVTFAANEVPREQAPNRAMYVRGQCSVENDTTALPDRIPGLFTGDRPAHPAGKTTVTAVQDAEFWCFNYVANRRALPNLTPIRLSAGDVLTLSAGQNLFVMLGKAGDLQGPMTYVPEGDEEYTVESDSFYALIVAEAR
jgi:hypothetical protein